MNNADMPAMPVIDADGAPRSGRQFDENYIEQCQPMLGMTKREMMAMAAMQGLCAHSGDYHLFADLASDAVNYADALLAELERTKGESK